MVAVRLVCQSLVEEARCCHFSMETEQTVSVCWKMVWATSLIRTLEMISSIVDGVFADLEFYRRFARVLEGDDWTCLERSNPDVDAVLRVGGRSPFGIS